jgi:hypothetical protein
MRNNALYLQLKHAASNGNYTVEQAKSITKAQIESILGTSIGDNFYANMKNVLVNQLSDEADDADMKDLREQLIGGSRQWLGNHFPNAEFERGQENGKKYIKIWLAGKPEVVEE